MPHQLYGSSVSSDIYVQALSAAYRAGRRIYDPEFALRQDPEIYEKIRRDAVIAQALTFRKHLIAGRSWNIEPSGTEPADKKAAVVVRELIAKIERLSSTLFNLAEAVVRGSAYALIIGRRMTLRIADFPPMTWWVPVRLKDVDRRRFRQVVDDDGNSHWEFWSVKRYRWEKLENPGWFVRHIYDDTEPSLGYGRGLLEALYFYNYAKQVALERGLQGLERWAMGILLAAVDSLRVNSNTTDSDDLVQQWIDTVNAMRSQHVLVYDKNDSFSVLTGGGEGWQIVREILEYLDNAMRTLILGANLPTSATEGGSFALGQVQENSTEALVQYDRRLLEETLTRDLVGRVLDMNRANFVSLGLPLDRPRFNIAQEKREDPSSSIQVIATAISAGISLRRDEVYQKIGFTPPGPDDETITRTSELPATLMQEGV